MSAAKKKKKKEKETNIYYLKQTIRVLNTMGGMTERLKVVDCKSISYILSQVRILLPSKVEI